MHIKRMKEMEETLVKYVHCEVEDNLECVDTKELGEAMDIIKDLEEAIYYATITKAMELQDESKHQTYYYTDRMRPMSGEWESDPHMGKSHKLRKTYMEGRAAHHDKMKQMEELEQYMHELSTDITEMIQDASPEEKALLIQKLNTLATKIK